MKIVVFAFVIVLALLANTETVSACWCRREALDTEQRFRAAMKKEIRWPTIIFSGQLIEQNKDQLRFKVAQVWKGDFKEEIFIHTDDYTTETESGTIYRFVDSCEYKFELGSKYLIYVLARSGKLTVSKCSFTKLLKDADRDIKELDRLALIKDKKRKAVRPPVSLQLPIAYSASRRCYA